MSRVSRQPGFTLIELMISITIVTILSLILFINFSNQNKKEAVRQAANQIALDLQRMYSQAQAGLEQGGVTQLAYGLSAQVADASYSTYFDAPANADGRFTDASELLTLRKLPTNVTISAIQERPVAGGPISRLRTDVQYAIPGAALSVKVGSGGALSNSNNRIIITVQYTGVTSITQCVAITPSIGAVNLSCT